MVKDQVKLEGDPHTIQRLDVGFGDQLPVEVVIDDGKTAVKVAIEEGGQNVEQGEDVLELRPAQQGHDIGQPAANAVGIGVQHRTTGQMLPCGVFSLLSVQSHDIQPFDFSRIFRTYDYTAINYCLNTGVRQKSGTTCLIDRQE